MTRVKVSVVATAKDVGPAIHEFLASLGRQTRAPEEVVVVDGGSSDGVTVQALERAEGVTLLREPEANIARGRNVAIRAAAHDVIAVSDADCVLSPLWLERLLEPIEAGADVAAGFYRPLSTSFFETCAAAVSVREPDEISSGWMPSSRSLAFRREAFEAAGGYPEWLDVGEDMYLNHRFVAKGIRMDLAPEAVVYWRIRPTLAATWRQYARYAEGDALAGMYPERHLLRFGTYSLTGAALWSRRPWPLALLAAAGGAYAARPVRRAWRRLPDRPPERLVAVAAVPALMAFVDGAKMWGYLRGLARRARREPRT